MVAGNGTPLKNAWKATDDVLSDIKYYFHRMGILR